MALYAFDGTWNKERDGGEYGKNTNVVRFKNLYNGPKYFYVGVGTRHGFLGKVAGGAFGVGGHDRIAEAQRDLEKQFSENDTTIDIVGFSRGAALAVHFANVIADTGVKVRGQTVKPEIRFLGLWDVVAAFGIPIDIGLRFNRVNLGYKLTLPKNVKQCYHGLALDESRKAFRPTRVPEGCEVWFRGVHSDVGGGNENLALSDISLRWMLRKGLVNDLPLPRDCVENTCLRVNAAAPVGDNFDIVLARPREPKAGDRYHYTVTDRPRCVNPPNPCERETELFESRTFPYGS
jgi:uncharacterized protein (DUF2235 family)